MNSSSPTLIRILLTAAVCWCAQRASAQLSLSVLHSFSGGPDGQQPYAGLVQGVDQVLYGTTYMGGTNNAGTIFKVNPDGSGNTPIYHFNRSTINPLGLSYPSGLIQGADGGLYGTTGFGGTAGRGSVFRINTDGTAFTVLHSFGTTGGYEPTVAVTQGDDGTLYGTTQGGGDFGFGTVFKLNTNGTGFTQLYSFGAFSDDARSPQAPLLQGLDGNLYGTSSAGGASAIGGASGYGTIFRLRPDGSGEAVLHSFVTSGGDGQRPYASLVQDGAGALYGTTQEGGNFANGGSSGFGTVFKLNPDGTQFTILHNFNPGTGDGKYPNSALVIGTDGALYGTTEFGGTNNSGVVFNLNTDGSQYEVLYSFGSTVGDGANPKAPLVRAASGGLFGTAQFGGESNNGTIFRVNPAPSTISVATVRQPRTLALVAAPHFTYRIDVSTDAVHWVVLTNVANLDGLIQFTDPSSAPQKFYRAAWVP
jgi:uncharacterized repeat protein (TIGR03803 family)